jgi:hypothetical protein
MLLNAADIWVDTAQSHEHEISENSAATNSMYAENSNLAGPQKDESIDLDDLGLDDDEEEDEDGFGEITELSSSCMPELHDSMKSDRSKANPSMLGSFGSLGAPFSLRLPSLAFWSPSTFAIQSKEAKPQMRGIKIKFNPRVSSIQLHLSLKITQTRMDA